jgi:hypothetical protein
MGDHMLSMKSLVEALGGRKVLKCRIEKLDDLREAAKWKQLSANFV